MKMQIAKSGRKNLISLLIVCAFYVNITFVACGGVAHLGGHRNGKTTRKAKSSTDNDKHGKTA
jgi:hypothetical protein